MSNTYSVSLADKHVQTTIISTIPQLNECLNKLLSTIMKTSTRSRSTGMKRAVGLDIKKKFNTNFEASPRRNNPVQVCEKVALLQLCYGTTCLIIQLHRMSLSSPPSSLSAFLQLSELCFVGVGIAHCLEALERDYGIKCRNAVDLGHLSAKVTRKKVFRFYGLLDLVDRHMSGLDLRPMSDCVSVVAMSDWGVEILYYQQIEAATCASFFCFYEGNRLLEY